MEPNDKKMPTNNLIIRQDIFFLMLKLIYLDIIAVVIAISYLLVMTNQYSLGTLNVQVLIFSFIFFLVLFFIKIIFGFFAIMRWVNDYFEIREDVLIRRSGFPSKKEEKHNLSEMKEIKLQQSFIGKIFGFGTVSIWEPAQVSGDNKGRSIDLYLIHDPQKVYEIIKEMNPKLEEEKDI